mgnify:CR=1 FL=1
MNLTIEEYKGMDDRCSFYTGGITRQSNSSVGSADDNQTTEPELEETI